MNIPTPEHEETRHKDLYVGLTALLPGPQAGLGLVVTLTTPRPCGCCWNVEGAIGITKHMGQTPDPQLVQFLLAEAMRRLIDITQRSLEGIDEEQVTDLISHAINYALKSCQH